MGPDVGIMMDGHMGNSPGDVWDLATAQAYAALAQFVDWSRGWLRVQQSNGPAAAAATWREVHAGRTPPDVGHVVSMWD